MRFDDDNCADATGGFTGYYVQSAIDYYPFGKVMRAYYADDQERYLTTQHERNRQTGLDYREARFYDSDLGRFLSLDPLALDYPSWSDYNYVLGNPIMFIDPDGRSAIVSTDVIENEDGTSTVVGGNKDDGDKGIYVVDQDGNRTKKLGEPLTMYSFYNADTQDEQDQKGWKGTINTNSTESGDLVKGFMKEANSISLAEYVPEGANGGDYDFKRGGDAENDNRNVHHRGSVWSTKADGTKIYGTARDAGNFAAGYIAGYRGLSWGAARAVFDGYEFLKSVGHTNGPQST